MAWAPEGPKPFFCPLRRRAHAGPGALVPGCAPGPATQEQ